MEVPPSGQAGLLRFTDIIVYSNNNRQTDFNTNLSLILIFALSEEKLGRKEGIYPESWPDKEMPRCEASLKNKVHLRQVGVGGHAGGLRKTIKK